MFIKSSIKLFRKDLNFNTFKICIMYDTITKGSRDLVNYQETL